MIEQALEYAARGWSVIPLHARGKKPLLPSWREHQTRPADAEQVRAWWTAMPDANIGVLTGRVSGIVVVDLDGGDDDPDNVLSQLGVNTSGPVVTTGKGFHVYYRHPGGEIRNGVRIAKVGTTAVDIRGDGGYVVAPPSVHESGNRYSWLTVDNQHLPLLPEAFRRGALPTATPDAAPESDARALVAETAAFERILKGVTRGERNNAAAKIAGYFLRVCGGNETAAYAAVCGWNRLNDPPLNERELRTTFESIARRHRITGGDCPSVDESGAGSDGAVRPSRLTVLSGAEWATAVRDIPPRVGVPAPSWPGLEEVGGIVPKDLLVLAGRPGMGKSTVAWGVVLDVCIRQRVPTLIFSTEMTAADVARWIGAMRWEKDQYELSEREWEATLNALSRAPVTICDAGTVKVTDIVDIVQQRPELKLVIIDHIQRLVWSGEARNQAIEAGAAMLKGLAKDHDCTVLALSQLNRVSAYEKRRPELHDLRDSGGLEQEADAVCFIWTDAEDVTQIELPVRFWWAKNRHGRMVEREAIFKKVVKRYIPVDECVRVRDDALRAQHIEQMNRMLGEHE